MTYTLQTTEGVDIDQLGRHTTLGKALERATDLLQYMESGTEVLIINDLGNPVYSVRFINVKQFTFTELN